MTKSRLEFLKKQAVVIGRVAAERIFAQYRAQGKAGSENVAEISRADLAAAIAVGALNAWQTAPEDVG